MTEKPFTQNHLQGLDLAHLPSSESPASLLAEVKIWKTYQDANAFSKAGHEYPFVFLDGHMGTGGFGVHAHYLNDREKELNNFGHPQQNYGFPKTIGKLAATQGNLCCFQPVNGGGQLIATDADEGQLFKDFVKMLSYKDTCDDSKYDMLQVLYIVSEKTKWCHVHDQKYILGKLEHLFREFYEIAKIANQFNVYNYITLQQNLFCKLCSPRATVHFGDKKTQNNSDITPLVIEWGYQDEAGSNNIFSVCSNDCVCRGTEALTDNSAQQVNPS